VIICASIKICNGTLKNYIINRKYNKNKIMKNLLMSIYHMLYETFGKRHWWPGNSAFEIMVGAILTQNTAWANVEKAIINLKNEKLLSPGKLQALNLKKLKYLIKPAGFYNVKAKRLKSFLSYLNNYQNNFGRLKKKNLGALRRELLSVDGIGPETADSILLYALNRPIFVVDAYTKRIFSRHKLVDIDIDYDNLQKIFMSNLPHDYKLFNEYHALIVELGKKFCKSKNPKCAECPLKTV